MTQGTHETGDHLAPASLGFGLLDRLRGVVRPVCPLATAPMPIRDLAVTSELAFFLGRNGERSPSPAVQAGEEIEVGHVLFTDWTAQPRPSPVRGKVAAIRTAPDVAGGKSGLAVAVTPAEAPFGPAFPGLDPEKAAVDALRERLREAAVFLAEPSPRRLADCLEPAETLIVLAADREPALSGTSQLLRERPDDAARATVLLARLTGARESLLAVLKPLESVAGVAASSRGIRLLALPPRYPATLEPMVARRAGARDARIVPLETALAALDAVTEGRVQDRKVLTVVAPDGRAVGNFRVPLGARIGDVLAALGIRIGERHKVVAGGPMRGFAQYSAEAAVDAGVDGIVLLPPGAIVPWSDEPCINCGACIDACPARLQVQLLGRYSEFSLFERTRELSIDACFECGLCAAVCTARRPLLQLIRLAKRQLVKDPSAAPVGTEG